MDTRGVFLRTDGDIFPFFRFHSFLAVTRQTGFVLWERLRFPTTRQGLRQQ